MACYAQATRIWLAVNHNTSITIANECGVLSALHGQVSLAAVNQILCNSRGYERLQKSKDSLKDCFENVNMYVCHEVEIKFII